MQLFSNWETTAENIFRKIILKKLSSHPVLISLQAKSFVECTSRDCYCTLGKLCLPWPSFLLASSLPRFITTACPHFGHVYSRLRGQYVAWAPGRWPVCAEDVHLSAGYGDESWRSGKTRKQRREEREGLTGVRLPEQEDIHRGISNSKEAQTRDRWRNVCIARSGRCGVALL